MFSVNRRIGVAAACAAALAGGLVFAQAPQQRPPVFRGGAVLVTVDAYPQRDGKIVEGLTAADFEVLEDGKPQTVENLEFVRIEPSLSEAERRDPNTQQEANALAADPHNRVFVVFLDQLHVTVGGSHAIRRPLVDSLNRIIAPNDLFGVMTQNIDPRHLVLGRRLLTVEEQLTKYWTWGERYRLGVDESDPMEQTLKACFEVKPVPPLPPWYVSDNGQERLLAALLIDRRREDRTLTSLERLVDHLSGLREARTVALVITDGWRLFPSDRALADEAKYLGPAQPAIGSAGGRLSMGDPTGRTIAATDCTTELLRLSMIDNERRLRELITRANRANVSFYPVTPSGLATFDTPISERSRPGLAEDGNRLRLRTSGLRTLAENTDGIAVVDTNDLAAGMRRIVDDVSAYYLLGYYSTNTRHDGRFRRIEVKVKQPGLQVRARRGYLAPVDAPSRAETRAAAPGPAAPAGLEDALAPLSRLRAAADVFTRGVIDRDSVKVAVEIAAARASSAPWNGGAVVQIVVSGPDGASLPPVTGRIEPNTRGVVIPVAAAGLALPLRVVAKVSAGGESLEDSAELGGSGDAIVGDALLYRGRPAATSPLRAVADLHYRRIERVHVEWTLRGEIDQRSARLLGRTGQPLAVPVTLTERETEGRRVLAADLNLAPLSAGDYVIELVVGRGGVTERKLVAFRVVP